MKRVVNTEKQPIKLWLDDIEAGALDQARNLANLPFVFKHIAVMPDAHQGYGMPIGGVMAAEEVVIPNAVGVDIGCGMCAVKTSLTSLATEKIKAVLAGIRKTVPLGFQHHKKKQDPALMPQTAGRPLSDFPVVAEEYGNALTQIGTLGGGNHFIEIQQGNDSHVWLMIHSGSRNLGFKVANHYNRLAMDLNRKWGSRIPEKWQLAFLPLDKETAQRYLREMRYCVEFAYANRKLMMERVKEALLSVVPSVVFEPVINIAHNYAALETHFHKNVMVHRKGATSAREGEIGIIPGSQGSPSYIVRGRGNPESFQSCAHGAGRKMGRKQAQRQLDLHQEQKKLEDQGIIHAVRGVRDLDEAAGAYKNIDEVIENQIDLVEVIVELRPLAVIKG
ncbi:MAG: RtcB family protein [Deltaproteobacteria bacterium]|nr:RtcB family protein [Deltaproteobacteria bacterium]